MDTSAVRQVKDDLQGSHPWFSLAPQLRLERADPDWDLVLADGPVVACAVHDGHLMRESLRAHLAVDEAGRRRDEDPLTGMLTTVGDVRLRVRASRFQVDLNRPRNKALSANPADTWGLRIWQGELPDDELQRSLAAYDRFYQMIGELLDRLLERWPALLLLDIHSYNHRRDGADATAAPQQGNPDLDLGATTLDADRWGATVDRFADALTAAAADGRPATADVRRNVRYEGGGHFPEWVYRRYGARICTMSLEYKKVYMDEWTAQADIDRVERLRESLDAAVRQVRPEFER